MLYRDFKGLSLSALGFGAMRMPTQKKDLPEDIGEDAVEEDAVGEANESNESVEPRAEELDLDLIERMIDRAMEAGVNYYDTGWDYHNGLSEGVLGRFLAKYPRNSYFYADKYPGYNLDNFGKTDEIFTAQLERGGLDRFDFYLLHNVCELNIEQYLDDERYGTVTRLLELKEQGLIGHLGFSTHGNLNTLRRFLARYGDVVEFCQIQLNWLDWEFQAAGEKVSLLADKGLPIIVMEPLRGGSLASLAEGHQTRLDALRARDGQSSSISAAEWGFRYLQGIPGVICVLSGVSSLEQLEDNVRIFSTDAPATREERALLHEIAQEMVAVGSVPCTACRYCTTHCPQGLDIPRLIELWNEHTYTGNERDFIAPMALGGMPENKRPSACIGCKTCEPFCPQQIEISKVLHDFSDEVTPTGEDKK